MSADLMVYMARVEMPSPVRWAEVIRNLGFPAELTTDFDVHAHRGFLPCRYQGAQGGFEYASAPVTPEEQNEVGLPEHLDYCVTFTTNAHAADLASAVVCAGVLCLVADGRLTDPQTGEDVDPDAILSWIRAQLADLQEHFA